MIVICASSTSCENCWEFETLNSKNPHLRNTKTKCWDQLSFIYCYFFDSYCSCIYHILFLIKPGRLLLPQEFSFSLQMIFLTDIYRFHDKAVNLILTFVSQEKENNSCCENSIVFILFFIEMFPLWKRSFSESQSFLLWRIILFIETLQQCNNTKN